MHKTANVLNKLPKSVQGRAKNDLHEIWMAESRETAGKAFDSLLEKYREQLIHLLEGRRFVDGVLQDAA